MLLRSEASVRRSMLVPAAALLGLLGGCGGQTRVLLGSGPEDDGGGPSPNGGATSTGMTSGGAAIPEIDPIDDMEDGDERILVTKGRSGSWMINNDGTPGAMQFPSAHGFFVPTRIAPPRGSSQWAAHTYGAGFLGMTGGDGWAEIALDFVGSAAAARDSGPNAGTYDASAYRGVTFWARVGENAQSVVRLNVPDSQTNPRGGQCDADAGECYNSFGENLALTTEWTQYTVPFSALGQRTTFGKTFAALDIEHLFALNFDVTGAAPFDLWVDDIAFFK